MTDYIRRYERVMKELKTACGGEIAKKVKVWHLLGQARLAELNEQVVVGACYIHEWYDRIN